MFFFCWSNVFHNNTLISLSASHFLGNGTLAPLGHDSFVIFFFDERFVDHLDHRVAAEDAFGSHQVVELHSQLEKNWMKPITKFDTVSLDVISLG